MTWQGLESNGLMEVFLAEYGLSTDEGVALMCLAEALLRVPDAETIDELIEDKISPSSSRVVATNERTRWGFSLSPSYYTHRPGGGFFFQVTELALLRGEYSPSLIISLQGPPESN